MKINFVKLSDTAIAPTLGTIDSAGYDLFSDSQEPINIEAFGRVLISTGIALEIPVNYYGQLISRSSLSLKQVIVLGGVIDADYRGPIKVILYNCSNKTVSIDPKTAIAQIIIIPIASRS